MAVKNIHLCKRLKKQNCLTYLSFLTIESESKKISNRRLSNLSEVNNEKYFSKQFLNHTTMKFFLSVALAAIFMTGTVQAQQVSFGIKGGLNIYDIHNSNNINYDPVVGFHIGGLSHIHLTKHFALQPEVFYSTNGANYKSGGNDFRINLGYISVPVLVQYMFTNGLRVQAGPQVGFLVHAISKDNNIKENIREDINAVDFSLATGASYQVPNTGFGFDARFNLGLSDLNKNGTVKSTNRGVQLGVFYLFNKK